MFDRTIAGLATLGAADALYMLAYEEGLVDSLVCPFFGEGCNIVGRSRHARHFGVPNALVGAVGYVGMAALALGRRRAPRAAPPLSLALAGTAVAAAAASAFLTWEQATKVRAWCFWCLTSAALNVVILPLALVEVPRAWQALRAQVGMGSHPAGALQAP